MLFEVLTKTSFRCEICSIFSGNQPSIWAQNQAQVMRKCKSRVPPRMSSWLSFSLVNLKADSPCGGAIIAKERVQEERFTALLKFKNKESLLFRVSGNQWNQKIRGFFVIRIVSFGFFEGFFLDTNWQNN